MTATLTGTGAPTGTPAPTPTILDQLSDAIRDYPEAYLKVDIYSVNPVSGDGDVINAGDEVTFRLRVNNTGPLNALNLTLLVEAGSGATGVKRHGASTFQSNVTTVPITVPANQFSGSWTELAEDYHFLAGPKTKNKVDLVKVILWDWDGDLGFVLNTLAERSDETDDVYSSIVSGI